MGLYQIWEECVEGQEIAREDKQLNCPVYEDVRVKPKVQWTLQKVDDAKNVEYLLRTSSANEKSHPQREAIRATTGNASWEKSSHLPNKLISCHNFPQVQDMRINGLKCLSYCISVLFWSHVHRFLSLEGRIYYVPLNAAIVYLSLCFL